MIDLLPLPISLSLAGLFGLMLGSFFNVIIYRMPRGESVV
ncbi:MAG TPA: prepilin peptidase, partial [Fibrobacteria bacterium]|nr:prepilin peptidase [Fibrobacteria bacterium]